ncbi:hypothetical protein [Phaffia rhodozyma]|uniref:Uncharacterized protein n=1 Tax=Phaffia rhodozyma TaxID=264483 RepID=A0A0F7SEE0_PHARH|nr:hypothetical protein [Phaffia rhodozyma]
MFASIFVRSRPLIRSELSFRMMPSVSRMGSTSRYTTPPPPPVSKGVPPGSGSLADGNGQARKVKVPIRSLAEIRREKELAEQARLEAMGAAWRASTAEGESEERTVYERPMVPSNGLIWAFIISQAIFL